MERREEGSQRRDEKGERRGERQKTKQQLILLTSERDGFKQRDHHAMDGGGWGSQEVSK